MNHRLKCKMQNYKNLGKNMRENLWDLGLGRILKFDTKNTNPQKERLINWTSSKVKTLLLGKTLLKGWKEKVQLGRKTFAKCILAKWFVSRNIQWIFKLQLVNNQIRNVGQRYEPMLKENTQMANKSIKWYSTSLAI